MDSSEKRYNVPTFCDFATKTHTKKIVKIFWGLLQTPEIFENQNHSYEFCHEKMGPMLKDFLQKTDPNLWHVAVCHNM